MSILKANKNMISPKGKKILFFVGSMNAGGAERVAATLANAWASQGYQVRLVMTHLGSKSSFYPLLDQVDCVPLADFFQPSWVAPRLVAKWQAIRHVFYEFQPDVVLSFLTNVNINVLWALRRQRVPIIVSERTHPLYSRSSGYFLKWLRKRLYPRASAVVLQTQAAAEAFQTVTPGLKKVVVIPNPIPPKLLQFAMHEKPKSVYSNSLTKGLDNTPKVVALGRLVPVKRFDFLIHAFAALPSAYEHWHLIIYGDGPLRNTLTHLAKQAGVQKRVHLMGRTNRPWQHLARADLFILCSQYEGFPNALLEAMCLGIPCITLNCPSGPAELSEQGRVAKLLPKPSKPQDLTHAMASLMANKQQRIQLGQMAQRSVYRRYSLDAVLNQWARLFAELI